MYPWHEKNQFELLRDGENYFPVILDAIHHARHYVLIEMYLVGSGEVATTFIDTLIRAASQEVQVYLLFDAHGSLMLNSADRYRLSQYTHIHLCFYNPLRFSLLFRQWRNYLHRDHRKLIVVDNQLAFTGGTGLTDEFDAEVRGGKHWRETVVQIRGECVQDWTDAFIRQWEIASKTRCELPQPVPVSNVGFQQWGRVVTSPVDRHRASLQRVALNKTHRQRQTKKRGLKREVQRSLIHEIRHAGQRVYISSAYFVASRKIRRTLRRAAQRKVDVRLLLPGPEIDHPSVRHMARRFYLRLLRNGIRIFEYQPRFLHSKVLLCDDWVSIGSTNIDRWNLRWNFEANQEIRDREFTALVVAMFEVDFEHSKEIVYDAWCRRTIYGRLLEWFWGKVDRLLANVHRRKRSGDVHEEVENTYDDSDKA